MSAEEPLLRLARAAVFATVCLFLSTAGHAFAGGGGVDPAVLLAGLAGTMGLAYAINGREREPEVVLAASAVAQISLHEVFGWTTHSVPTALGTEHGHRTFGMTLAHLMVAMASGWWLYRGEQAAWLMLRLWATAPFPVLRWLFTTAGRTTPPAPPAVPVSFPQPRPAWTVPAAIHRRGPPAIIG
ncbi:hypothetical protein [Sphaerisporangium siamense]|uniref:MFS transporter n=1 Tax=Sphaerisporangium siamense TaxID=795645 RepID=A0A7W7GD92_9ACTN|nr:hypothetical protein [Sphaerisporangium siamense]MBB4702776.1 hypothetical protein [Sphaerisporangium siamense]